MKNKFVPTSIESQASSWGPFLWQSKLLPTIVEEILKRADSVRGNPKYNAQHKLAGIMKDEWDFKEDDKEWIKEVLFPWVHTYLGSYLDMSGENFRDRPHYFSDLWVNYQKQHDFNPLHNHGGSLSFVFYLNVPQEIIEEPEAWENTRGHKPGQIAFTYGEDMPMLCNQRVFTPNTGDIFIFPAWLQHMVIPFKTPDVERISVSGNIMF
tara:strand:+ start:2295 stop:2921 length:627 start_codon:yes stop_codon:yes gene_type:complete